MFKTNLKFMYIVITLLICIILIQVLQICTFKPKDFIENFEEEVQSLSKHELKLLNNKLSLILEKVNCIPDCNHRIFKNKKIEKNNKNKKQGVLFSEDDNDDSVVEEQVLDEDSEETEAVEGFIDGLSHNCSQV